MFKSDNYLMAFREAECFLNIAKTIKEKSHLKSFDRREIARTVNYRYGSHVNHAYAFELYLKCLMIIEKGEYAEGHGLSDLFNLLSGTAKANIERTFELEHAFIRRNSKYFSLFEKPSLGDLLDEANKAFINFRYLFSLHKTPAYELDGVIECLREEIFRVKPELREAW